MKKREVFEKYGIDESHSEWDHRIDNWMSVEVYLKIRKKLPNEEGLNAEQTVKVFMSFLDRAKEFLNLEDFGSLYLTSKRCIYRYFAAGKKE